MAFLRTSFVLPAFIGLVLSVGRPVAAQEQPQSQDDSPSLGDLARTLRKDKAQASPQRAAEQTQRTLPEHTVIDNENLSEVVDETKRAKAATASKTVFSLDSSGNTLKVSSPDVTCSMSFNARASALLVRPALVESLPMEELVKLDGPGSIQNDNLHMEVFNGTEWALREVTVGLTLERRPGEDAEKMARARVIPASRGPSAATVERHSDVTLLYHLKTEVKPFTKTALRQSIGITPGPDEDWRWSIVEAKGIRPSGARTAPASLSTPLYGNRVPDLPISNDPPRAGSATDKK
jgi:hypothetical protein